MAQVKKRKAKAMTKVQHKMLYDEEAEYMCYDGSTATMEPYEE